MKNAIDKAFLHKLVITNKLQKIELLIFIIKKKYIKKY